MPFWLKLPLVICLGICFGTWFSGESTRELDTEFLLDKMRDDMQRTTGFLAGLIVDSAVTGDEGKTETIIRQYAEGWSEFTYPCSG